MSLYFETAVSYDKMQENGTIKKTTERFLVDALSFAEAEGRTIEERTPYMSGDFNVKVAKKTPIAEIFNLGAERYYLAKVAFITIDEKSGVEKRSISQILVGDADFQGAFGTLLQEIRKFMSDWEIISLAETPIMDVYPAKLS